MSEWPRYRSHKVVRAAKIVNRQTFSIFNVQVDGGATEEFTPTVFEMCEKVNIGDYAMLYEDGYKSVCPAKSFEDGYSKVK